MIKEFKEFVSRGNVMDLAVGVIIGAAFGKIVSSLVENIISPILGIFIGGINLTSLSVKIGKAEILYGTFLQSVLDFVIIALCIFFVIKLINSFKKKEANIEEVVYKQTQEEILAEIRDILQNK